LDGRNGSITTGGYWCDRILELRYYLINPSHRCSSSPSSTTQ
jgi:hypothetical protein